MRAELTQVLTENYCLAFIFKKKLVFCLVNLVSFPSNLLHLCLCNVNLFSPAMNKMLALNVSRKTKRYCY